jgi:NAD(P)-dependent dehydrogenase (short-subunit alcohol dehydrogenase family)
MRYDGRTVIITGGTQGIGEGCGRVFVHAGASTVIASPDRARGEALAEELSAAGPGRARYVECDVTRTADLCRTIEGTVAIDGRLDCLINNAGWHPPHRPIDDFSAEEFRALLELNVISVFTASRLALPHLRRTRGSIINMASLVATTGQMHAVTYAATKGALVSFTKALAIDEAAHGVRVNSVSPGNVFTPLWEQVMAASPEPDTLLAQGISAQALGRMGTPEEVGRLCLFLAAEATFTTGVDHIISGGAELAHARSGFEGSRVRGFED